MAYKEYGMKNAVALSALALAAACAGVALAEGEGNTTSGDRVGEKRARRRTVEQQLADRPLNVRDFGAMGDGKADDTAAIQTAIDQSRPSDGHVAEGRCVYVPNGTYVVSAPIAIYSGSCIGGEGPGSKLRASATFSATGLLVGGAASRTTRTFLEDVVVRDLAFEPSAPSAQRGLWAIDLSTQETLTHVLIDGVWFTTSKGINASSYLQHSTIRRVFSYGELDQLLWVRGNHNLFESLDKEASHRWGHTGSTQDPYILIEAHAAGASHANHFRLVLLEQITSARKTLFVARGTDELVLEDMWFEPTATDGYALRLVGSTSFQVRGAFTHVGTRFKVAVTRGSYGTFASLNADGEDVPWTEVLEVDGTSHVEVGTVFSRRSAAPLAIDRATNLHPTALIDRTLFEAPVAGLVPITRQGNHPSQNLLVNPSFEAGEFGWGAWGGRLEATFATTTSEVGPGRMAHMTWFTKPSQALVQSVSVPAAWVGRTMALSYLARITGAGYAAPFLAGAGVTGYQDSTSRTSEPDGWQLVTLTFKPRAAGTVQVGVWVKSADASTILDLDGARLAFGDEGQPGSEAFQQLELANRSVTFGSGPPTTGTWKQGDLVLNGTPTAGSPFAWRAIAAGTPGIWEAIRIEGGSAGARSH